ncbi:hypothetical protein MYCOZU1_05822 (plasmid) [Mycobacterium intracellulare subsp. chimaera]|nr:hypothetical protein MYCODSM44623_05767 [Mycobacterium intracellulare subsp. chimaera]ASL24183.1 hypothetical protein MYCOZU1_05822 [Mycobacterium intracellulare subsp. chimaera]
MQILVLILINVTGIMAPLLILRIMRAPVSALIATAVMDAMVWAAMFIFDPVGKYLMPLLSQLHS